MKVQRYSMMSNRKPLSSCTLLSATEAERVGMVEDVGMS